MAFDGAGNTLGTARELNITSTTQTFVDSVGSTDTNDFYRFNLGLSSSFNLTLNGLSADADVELIRDTNNNGIVDSGEVIARSTAGGASAESIISTLEAGTFYLRVYPYGNANTSYNLNVSATPRAIPLDFAGNNLGNARQITLNSTTSTYTDWVGSADTNDFYRFIVGSTSSFNLTLNGLSADADVQLIRDTNNNGVVDSGEVIASSTAGGANAESIIRTLEAGTFYLRVYPYGNADTNYNLNVSATPVDYALNTLGQARQITLNSTISTYTDWVGSSDTNDFYRFNLNGASSFNLTLNGLSADADVELIRDINNNGVIDSGEVIARSTAGGASAESIIRTLEAGTFYLRVYPYGNANTNYNLNVSATPSTIPLDFAGNNLGNARQITLNPTTSTYTDWVGSVDTNDFYRFNLGLSSSFNLTLNGLSADADVELIRDINNNGIVDSGEVIARSTAGGASAESIIRTLEAGTFYLRVYPYGNANTSYNLNVSATPRAIPLDFAGNNLGNARQITLNSTGSTYTDWVGSVDTDDYYRFTLNTNSSLNLAVNGLTENADVQLIRDANNNGVVDSGEIIISSTASGANVESIISTLDAGTYYVRVYPNGSANTNYNLNVSATPVDYAGNTLSSARQITLNPTTSTYTDWVGSADTNDFYRFNLGLNSSLNLAVNGLTENADVQLIRDANNNGVVDSGEVIISSTASGANPESIISTLDAGTYYVRVYPNGSANTNYNLNISATPVDYAGNTLSSARQITLNPTTSTYTDWVGSADNNDFYSFNLGLNSSLNLTVNGLTENADVQLIRDANNNGVVDSGEVIISSTASGANVESIISTLDAGTYYVRVYPNGNANTNYNLNISATPLDYAGNTLNNARQITLNSSGSIYTDWVGSVDIDDYYRFSLDVTSSFNLALNGLFANADVQLIRDTNNNGVVDSGDVITSSTASGANPESIISTLDAGTYYVRIYPNGSVNTSYNLNISATPVDYAGNTLNNARQITLNTTTDTYADWVGLSDTNDFYRFSVGFTSKLNLVLNGLSGNADVELIRDINNNGIVDIGEVIQRSTASGITAESINSILDTGTYYIRVNPDGGANTGYKLNVSAIPEDYAGNNLSNARQITLNSTGSTYTDWVGIADTDDYYRFTLDTNSTFNLAVNGLTENADVQLIRDTNNNGVVDSGEIIISSTASGANVESIISTLDAGTYYVRVYPNGSANTNYNLNVSATPLGFGGGGSEPASNQLNLEWIRQLGTTGDDYSNSVATDSAGNVYITGYTEGSLGGANAGGWDAWFAKYNSSGTLLWKKQVGTASEDSSYSIAVDNTGNIYITVEGGNPSGDINSEDNIWLAKYDTDGNFLWTQELGSNGYVFSSSLTVDRTGNVYITGATWGSTEEDIDVVLTKYDGNGNLIWNKKLGTTSYDDSSSVAVDSNGNVYITGGTQGALGGASAGDFDAWVAKYDSNGNQVWNKQLGTNARDSSFGVSFDSNGNVYITGGSEGGLGGNSALGVDAWLAKYSATGNLLWSKKLGTSGFDVSNDVVVDSAGNVYITGLTDGVLEGTNAGEVDAWIAKYDSNGNQISIKQLGTSNNDVSRSITIDSNGNVLITGTTRGNFAGTNTGEIDAWFAKLR
jgi:Beta-propeller repeat/Bacterial pre-peptidase C-terminal domain